MKLEKSGSTAGKHMEPHRSKKKGRNIIMEIKKLYKTLSEPYHMVLETLDGSFMRFYIAPFRKIAESDLTPVPYFVARGRNAEEAQDYFYKLYGLEKTDGGQHEK